MTKALTTKNVFALSDPKRQAHLLALRNKLATGGRPTLTEQYLALQLCQHEALEAGDGDLVVKVARAITALHEHIELARLITGDTLTREALRDCGAQVVQAVADTFDELPLSDSVKMAALERAGLRIFGAIAEVKNDRASIRAMAASRGLNVPDDAMEGL